MMSLTHNLLRALVLLLLTLFNTSLVMADQGLTGTYWNHNNAGNPTPPFPTGAYDHQRVDATVDFSWGNGSPHQDIGQNNFAVSWLGSVTAPESGDYIFRTRTDDGVRLWVNGLQIIIDWADYAPKNNDSYAISLVAGEQYQIRMEYYERGGGAVAQLLWQRPSSGSFEIIPEDQLSTDVVPIPEVTQGLLGSYWNQNAPHTKTFPTGPADMTRLDYQVNFNWGSGSPDSAINNNGYVVSWTGSILATQSGDYRFRTRTDDGVRLWINGNLVIEDWGLFGAKNLDSGLISLVAGQYYEVRMEYMEHTGNAVAQLSWQEPASSWQIIPNSQLFPPFDAAPLLDWHLDESSWSGTPEEVIDQSGNNNHGSIVDIDINGPSTGHVFTNSNGLICGAGQFESDNLLNQFYGLDSGVIPTDKGTIGFWYQPNSNNGTQQTLFDGNSATFYFHLRRGVNGRLEFSFEDSLDNDFVFYSAPILTNANDWVYITASWDLEHQTVGLTANGQPLDLTSDALDFSVTEQTMGALQSLYFGDSRSNYNVYLEVPDRLETAHGQIDEIVIFDRMLTVDDVQLIYANNLAGTNWDGGARGACPKAVDHYRLALNDNQGLTCEAEPMQLIACSNADCSQRFQQQVSITMSPATGWSQANPIVFTQQTTNLTYAQTTAGIATYSASSKSPDAPLRCYIGVTAVDCETEFSQAGFKFLYQGIDTVANQVAGTEFPQQLKVQAVKDNNGVCEGLFNGNVTIELAQQSSAPTTISSLDFMVDGQAIAKNVAANLISYTDISLNFDTNSMATLTTPLYQDAGQIQLHARYQDSGIEMLGSSNLFWVAPYAFNITTTNQQDPHPAGNDFDLAISAVNQQGIVTPGYQSTTATLRAQRTAPTAVGSVDADFFYSSSQSAQSTTGLGYSVISESFIAGEVATTNARYLEVGALTLSVTDQDYGGVGLTVNSVDTALNHFSPDHLLVEVTNTGALTSLCGQDFVYTGQRDSSDTKGAINYLLGNEPILSVTPQNLQGDTTYNYIETFNKLAVSDIVLTPPTSDTSQFGADTSTLLTLSSTLSDVTLDSAIDVIPLLYRLNPQDNFSYVRDDNSQINPFDSDIDITVASVTDSDGITANTLPTISPSNINVRYGRARLTSSYGPETNDLMMPLTLQHYQDGRFTTNSEESCFTYSASQLTFSPSLGNLAGYNDSKVAMSGLGRLILQAPGAGNIGSRELTYPMPSWLRFDWDDNSATAETSPMATAIFGRYRGNDRVISWREVK